MELFCPVPEYDQPMTAMTCSMTSSCPSRIRSVTMPAIFLFCSMVPPAGRVIMVNMVPWSSSGRKDEGSFMKPQTSTPQMHA